MEAMDGLAPGIHVLSHQEYHGMTDRLSHSGAVLLAGVDGCPAKFRYWLDTPVSYTSALDVGQAVHTYVSKTGPKTTVTDVAKGRDAKAAKAFIDEAHAEGKTPLLAAEDELAHAMADAVLADPYVQMILKTAEPEVSFLWDEDGIPCRGRADWLGRVKGRNVIVDLKTVRRGNRNRFSRDMTDYGYPQQGDWYRRGLQILGLADEDTKFVLVTVEKTPPYIVTPYQLSEPSMAIGWHRNNKALATYRACMESGEWPGYTQGITLLETPPWYDSED